MRSYTQALSDIKKKLKIASTDTSYDADIMQYYNESVRTVCTMANWWFTEYSKTIPTVAGSGVSSYASPARDRIPSEIYVTVGTTIYRPTPVYDMEKWTRVIQTQMSASDIPLFYRLRGSYIDIYPASASTAGTITVRGRSIVRDLSQADYTTGTIVSVTSGGTTVTGSGTSWNSSMAGRYIRIANTTTVNNGDGYWYEISSVSGATSLTLVAPYDGTTISGGSASYNIAEVSPIPEQWDIVPAYRTIALFFQINQPGSPEIAKRWWMLYDGGCEAGYRDDIGGMLGQMIAIEGASNEDQYLSPIDLSNRNPNYPPVNLLTGM